MALRKLDYEKIHCLRKEGHTCKQICDLTGAAKTSVYLILRKQVTQCGYAIRNQKAIKAINHILKNGGRVVDTIQRLRLSVSESCCRRVAVAHNINPKEYTHYLKENINWVIDIPNQVRFIDGYSHKKPYANIVDIGKTLKQAVYVVFSENNVQFMKAKEQAGHIGTSLTHH